MSGDHAQVDLVARPSGKGDQHLKAELLPLAAHQVRDPRLADPQALRYRCLGELAVADELSEIAHQGRPHLEDRCLLWRKAELKEDTPADLHRLLHRSNL